MTFRETGAGQRGDGGAGHTGDREGDCQAAYCRLHRVFRREGQQRGGCA